MAVFDAQVILPSVSGLPADSYTNSWHFNVPDDANQTAPAWVNDATPGFDLAPDRSRIAAAIAQRLQRFYDAPTEEGPVSAYLGDSVVRSSCSVKVTRRGGPRPWYPIDEITIPLTAAANTALMIPHECAVVLAFNAGNKAGDVSARRRGRIYFGPLGASSVTNVAGQGPRVNLALQRTLVRAASRLKRETGNSWVTLSTEGGAQYSDPIRRRGRVPGPDVINSVTTVYVDNAFDTQRRRGPKATNRLIDTDLSDADFVLAA